MGKLGRRSLLLLLLSVLSAQGLLERPADGQNKLGNQDNNNGTKGLLSQAGRPKSPSRRRREPADRFWNWEANLLENEWEAEQAAGLVTVSVVPENRLVSAFLTHRMFGRFLFMNNKRSGPWASPLSIVVTPCTSILVWSVNFLPIFDNTTSISIKQSKTLDSFRTQRTVSFRLEDSQRGIYTIEVRPLHSDTYVHFYVTTSPDFTDPFQAAGSSGPIRSYSYDFVSSAQLFLKPAIRVKRLRGNRIQVKWETSPINPHRMTYCIVVNARRDYPSLCGAQGDKFGLLPPDLRQLPYYYYNRSAGRSYVNELENDVRYSSKYEDMIIGCLGRKRNYILTELQEGRLYYFNVFLKDSVTNLSFPYVRTTLKYQIPKTGPNLLQDSKPFKVSLTKEKRTTTVKFNLKKPCSELSLYIMPCGGGSISYRILNGNQSVYESPGPVDSLDVIKIALPQRGKYYIKISQVEGLLNRRTMARMAEVLVSKRNKRFPLPKLPGNTKLAEVLGERTCDSVRIHWAPSPDPRDNEYCFFLKEETRKQEFYFKKPNQCDVERSLRSDPLVSHSLCLQRTPEPEEELLSQRITGLRASTTYVIQLILKRYNGKALSYDLTNVTTAKECLEN